jgi:hypothetical protein
MKDWWQWLLLIGVGIALVLVFGDFGAMIRWIETSVDTFMSRDLGETIRWL